MIPLAVMSKAPDGRYVEPFARMVPENQGAYRYAGLPGAQVAVKDVQTAPSTLPGRRQVPFGSAVGRGPKAGESDGTL